LALLSVTDAQHGLAVRNAERRVQRKVHQLVEGIVAPDVQRGRPQPDRIRCRFRASDQGEAAPGQRAAEPYAQVGQLGHGLSQLRLDHLETVGAQNDLVVAGSD
jgi:hypothetical protein